MCIAYPASRSITNYIMTSFFIVRNGKETGKKESLGIQRLVIGNLFVNLDIYLIKCSSHCDGMDVPLPCLSVVLI